MKNTSLSRKLLLASAFVFILFLLAAILVFYRGQTRLIIREMDRLLQIESLTISSLVNTDHTGRLDFEFSNQFMPQYTNAKFSSFFRFYSLDQIILKESSNSPVASCDISQPFRFESIDGKNYRILSYVFDVQPEEGRRIPPNTILPRLCLVVGNDEGPYRELVSSTIISTLPFLLAIFAGAMFGLQIIISSLTRDLSDLTQALANADFSSTRAFPKLPDPKTVEVKAIVNKLADVHHQATHVYKETLLFMARAAHQLKTPVAAIQATYDVLVRRERSKEELLDGMSDVYVGIRQMSQLTLKLISSTRINFESKPELYPLDLSAFFESQWKLFHFQAMKRNIVWEILPSGNSMVLADEYLLTEIFSNLIENALIYSPDNTKIQVSWQKTGGSVMVSISDQGPGFSKEVRDHLFEPFYRGDERLVGGSGLGLSIVRTAVMSLGGSIALTESGPSGSTMQVTLKAVNPK